MADFQAKFGVNVDTSNAINSIKALQSKIAELQRQLTQNTNINSAANQNFQRNLIADINSSGKYVAKMQQIRSTTEQFTDSLERNKLSMGQYFRYAASTSKTFGSKFSTEFKTIEKVARERVKSLQTQYVSMGRDANGALQSIAIRPLKLDLNNLATQQAINSQKQQIFNQLLRQGSTNLLNFGKNTQWAGRQLMVGFTLPLAIFGSKASQAFMSVEEQAIKFKRVYGELFTPPEEADKMLDSLKELGAEFTKYGVALEDTLSLAGDVAAMGKTGADMLAQVEQATRLSVLGGVDQSKALEASISITNAFGIAAEDLAQKIDFLNAVENQTVLSIDDLTTAIPKAGPVVQQLGGDVEDLAYFMTAMKEGGINASEGANALKSGLARLINPTAKATEFLGSFGININKIIEGNAGDIKSAVIELSDALDTLDPLNRARAIEELFGRFQFSRLSTLFQNLTAEGSQASRVLDLTASSAKELADLSNKELGNVSNSTTFKFKKTLEDFQVAIAPIGEQFLKAITPVIEFVTKIIKKFDEMGDGAKNFVVVLTAVLGAIAPVALMAFGLVANGVANLIKGFAAVRNIFIKTGQDSNILGSQLEYMTMEQVQAGSVAASLEQSHQRLAQQFTVEREALDMLIASYQRAITTGQGLVGLPGIGGAMGLSSKVAKYATGGIINGPGTGKSDSILAMLSNGEAVIPADVVRKNPNFINQLISGNIPGFADGVNLGDYKMRGGSEKAIDKLIQKLTALGAEAGDVTKMLDKLSQKGPMTAKGVKAAAEGAGMRTSSKGGPSYQWGHLEGVRSVNSVTGERTTGSLVRSMPASQNAKLKKGQGVDKFAQDWGSVTGGLYETVKLGGEKLTDGIKQATDQVDERIGQIAINMAKDGVISDEILAQATQIAIAEAEKKGGDSAKVSKALKKSSKKEVILPATAKTQRDAGILMPGETQEQGRDRLVREGRVTKSGRNYLTSDKSLSSTGVFARESSKGQFRTGHRVPGVAGEETYLKFGTASAKAFDKGFESQSSKSQDPYVEKRDRNSPHRLAKKDGQDDAKAYQSGFDSASGKKSGKSRRARGTVVDGQLQVSNPNATQSKGPRRASAPQQTAAADAAKKRNADIKAAEATAAATTKTKNLSGAMTGAMYGMTTLAGMAAMAGGEVGRIGGFMFQLTAGMTALMTVTEALTGQNVIQMIQNRVTLAQDAIATASKAGSIVATNGFTVAVSRASIGLMAFIGGPAGLGILAATIAIAGLVAGIVYWNKQNENARKKIDALGVAAEGARGTLADIAASFTGKDFQRGSVGTGVQGGTSSDVKKRQEELLSQEGALDPFQSYIDKLGLVSDEGIQGVVDQMALTFSSYGMEALDIEALIRAMLEKAGRTDLTLDFNSVKVEASGDKVKATAKDLAQKIKSSYDSLPKEQSVSLTGGVEVSSGVGYNDQERASKALAENMAATKELTSGVAVGLTAINTELENNSISASEAYFQSNALMNVFKDMDPALVSELLPDLAETLGLDNVDLYTGIADVENGLKLIKAQAMGMPVDAIADILASDPSTSEGIRQKAMAQTAFNKKYKSYLDGKEAELEIAEKLAIQEAIAADFASIDEEIGNLEEKNAAYDALIAKGEEAAFAAELVADSTWLEAYANAAAADAANNNTEAMDALITKRKDYVSLQGYIPEVKTGGNSSNPYEDAISSLKQQQADIKNTSIAYSRLRQSGMDIATASSIASDSTLALALATTKVGTSKYKELLSLVKQIDIASKNNAIKDLVSGRSQDIQLKSQFLSIIPLITDMGIEIQDALAILDEPDLAKAFIADLKDGKIDSKLLLNYLKQIQMLKKIDVEVNLMTDEQKWAKIEGAFNDVSAWFEAQSAKIEMSYRSQIEGQQNLIDKAQESIDEYNNKIYENEYQLEGIQVKEDAINKKYDSRIEALDKIVQVNKLIQAQEKGSMSVADALSRGDIAEAARAAQAARVELASANAEDLKARIAKAKEKEIASITAENGKTRLEIEAQIEEYKIRISKIEHDTVKPAESARDAAIAKRDAEKDSLTYLGLNKTAWGDIETNAKAAKVEAEGYKKAIEEAMALYAEMTGMEMPDTYTGSKPKSTADTLAELNQKIQSNRDAVRSSAGTTAADKKMMAENVKLINQLRSITGDSTTTGGFTKAMGGVIKRYASGGMAMGTDTVPAMLTPGEFVVKRPSVRSFGVDRLKAINNGTYNGESVYNYNLSVNVQSESNPSEIANTVMAKIKQVESKRLRGGRF